MGDNAPLSHLLRLTRAQFLPVIISPVLVGTALAWWTNRTFELTSFTLVLLGCILLHLASNTIDDAYDFESGVDVVSNNMFPPDFGGWKPLPRGLMTFSQAKSVAYIFFLVGAAVGLYLTILTGPVVLVLGLIGVFFAYFHVSPPLRLGYRGLGLSEFGIFLSFGVLPVVGSFYVQTVSVTSMSVLVGIPLGLLTASVLINHDQIFFDPYVKAGKRSLAVILGRKQAMNAAFILTFLAYAVVGLAVARALLPITSLLVLGTSPLFALQTSLYLQRADTPMHYVTLTQVTLVLSVLFGILLSAGLVIG